MQIIGGNKKVIYFVDYWRDLTNRESIEEQLIHTILYNPRSLFREFADEVKRKNLKNNENKQFFFNTIRNFAKLDVRALDSIKPTLTLIQQQFQKKDDYSYLSHLLEMIDEELSDIKIGKEAVMDLAEILLDESELNKRKIKFLVNLIIFDLTQKNYAEITIVILMYNIFSTYHI